MARRLPKHAPYQLGHTPTVLKCEYRRILDVLALEACRKLDVALIAYRPLSGGRTRQDGSALDRALAGIARAHQKTVAQVALNWLLSKAERIIPIPGATKAEHLRENVGAIGWTLGDDELAALEQPTA